MGSGNRGSVKMEGCGEGGVRLPKGMLPSIEALYLSRKSLGEFGSNWKGRG